MNMHKGAIVLSKNGKDVIECEHCGFKHINPLPTDQELEQLYKYDYYSTEKPAYLSENTEDNAWWSKIYIERYKKLELLLNKSNNSILDIGSGPGYFLFEGKKRGWITKGLEPNIQAYEFSKNLGLDVENTFLSTSNKNSINNFDVVNMGEVLEHIKDPMEFLKLVFTKLNDNGVLLLILPNDFNPLQKIIQQNLNFEPWWVVPEHHYNYFDFDSVKILLEKVGFLIEHTESTFPIDIFLLMGLNYVGNDQIGRQCHQLRKNFELEILNSFNPELLSNIYKSFANLNIGREIVIYARK